MCTQISLFSAWYGGLVSAAEGQRIEEVHVLKRDILSDIYALAKFQPYLN